MPMIVLYSRITCVLMIRNVINSNTKCYSSISNLMTGNLGWDYRHNLKKNCIWDREKKLSGSAAGLRWAKASASKYLHLLAAGVLWGLFVPVSGSLSPNSMNGWNAFVMNWDFSEKQVCQRIHARGFWIIESRKMLECLLISTDTPAAGLPQRLWSWGKVRSDKNSKKKTTKLVKMNQSCELERTRI